MGCCATFSCCEYEVWLFFPFSNEQMRCMYALHSDASPPFSSVYGKIPFSPLLASFRFNTLYFREKNNWKSLLTDKILLQLPAAALAFLFRTWISEHRFIHPFSIINMAPQRFSYCMEKIYAAKSLIFRMCITNLLKSCPSFPPCFSEL